MKVALCIPTYNGGDLWRQSVAALNSSSIPFVARIVVDSGSTDGTRDVAREAGFETFTISKDDFDHGGTRQLMIRMCAGADIVIFATQDAVLADVDTAAKLIKAFYNPAVGAAFSRQLPHPGARPIGRHARNFNYSPNSYMVSLSDVHELGIRAAFISNSFAAYRLTALADVGGFPSRVILGEDMLVAAKMLQAGWKVAYCADSRVFHSHDYSFLQEFRRYFDIGVFHSRESRTLREFGSPEGEGRRFVVSELRYLLKCAPWLLLSAVFRTALKYMGYRLGKVEGFLPLGLKRRFSMHKSYWSNDTAGTRK